MNDNVQAGLATVLVVDDTPVNLTLFKVVLEKNYRVLTATSGAQAIEIAKAEVPDIMLLDVMMPEMDGFATAEAIAKIPHLAAVPVIFVTSLSDKASYQRGLSIGAVDFLTKPIDVAILNLRVRNVLDRERLRLESLETQGKLTQALHDLTGQHNVLNSVFNASNDALLVMDARLNLVRMNGFARKFLGMAPEAVDGDAKVELKFIDAKKKRIDPFDFTVMDRRRECLFVLPDDSKVPVSVFANRFKSATDEDYYFFSIRDVSERLYFEEEQRKAKLQLLDIAHEMEMQKASMDHHSMVSTTDADGAIIYANELFCQVSGYTSEELMGQNHRLIKSDLHADDFYKQLWSTISKGKVWYGEIANRAKDGKIYWVATTIMPRLDKAGKPYQYVAIRTNITSRRIAEQQLAEASARERSIGASIQSRLLYGKPPTHMQGFAIACHSEPSDGIDGDFYTFTTLSPTCFELLIGDVMGKGVTAALIAAGVKESYRQIMFNLLVQNAKHEQPTPAQIVNAVHQALTPELIKLDSFVTMVLIRFDSDAKRITWVNAGHTPTLIATGPDAVVEELVGDNLPIGVLADEHFEQHERPMNVDDMVLVFSDGFSEAVNSQGEQFGVDNIKRLLHIARSKTVIPSILVNSIRSQTHHFADQSQMPDDRTAVVIQMRALRGLRRGDVAQRRNASSLHIQRSLDHLVELRQAIAQSYNDQPEEFVGMLTLAVFEAATNIIRHSPEILKNAPLTLLTQRDAVNAHVSLTYDGDVFDPKDAKEPDFSGNSTGGFGLYIIQNFVDCVGYKEIMPGIAEISLTKKLMEPVPVPVAVPTA